MDKELLKISEIGSMRIIAENTEGMPMWAVNHYVTEFCNNYNKILLVQKICLLMQQGYYDEQFYVTKKSAVAIPSKNLFKSFTYSDKKFIILTTKGENPKEFWNRIFNYVRPNVFVKDFNGDFFPIMDFEDDDAIKITSMSYNSPVKLDIKGAVDSLIDIANAGNRSEMEEENHIAEQIEQGAKNYESIARASGIVNSENTPDGVKHYANQGLKDLLEKQAILNKKLGIRTQRIDRKG